VFILISFFWDYTVRPLLEIIIKILNIIIMTWNIIAVLLASFGADVPSSDSINATIPDFKTFCLGILVPMLFQPIKDKLTGIIFA